MKSPLVATENLIVKEVPLDGQNSQAIVEQQISQLRIRGGKLHLIGKLALICKVGRPWPAHSSRERLPAAASDRAKQEFLVLPHATYSFHVTTQAMAAGGIEEKLDMRFLASLQQRPVNGNCILEEHVEVFHAVNQQELSL